MSAPGPLLVREASPAELAGWDDLVRRFPNHRVTHTMAWIRSLEAVRLGQPLFLVVERGGELVGCIPGLLARVGPLRLFGSPMPGWQSVSMGPAFDPARAPTREMVGALVSHLERHHGVHHVEMVSAALDEAAMAALDFRSEPMPTFRAPLHPGDETRTFRAMKDSARRNVRRAERLGLTVRFEDGDDFVDEHYAQIEEVFARRSNVVPFGRARLAAFVRHMRDAGCLVSMSVLLPDGRTRIATGTFTIAAGELVLWMWAHRTRARWYRPTELMTWTTMRRAMEAGCTSVDFMGRGDFKAVFGATPDDGKRRWVRSRLPLLMRARDLAQYGFRWQQAARGRLARLRLERSGALDATAPDAPPELALPSRAATPPWDVLRALWPYRRSVADPP
jgi:CelD/BcsL family acetyltransferase involved in cellulose biosynthesis